MNFWKRLDDEAKSPLRCCTRLVARSTTGAGSARIGVGADGVGADPLPFPRGTSSALIYEGRGTGWPLFFGWRLTSSTSATSAASLS